jgi:nucleoside-diphosphate-sugar epimerase
VVTGELVSGRRLAAAVTDVAVIVHCASNPTDPGVDLDGTRNLVEAARAVGIWHLVGISIVGVDRVPSATTRPSSRPSG